MEEFDHLKIELKDIILATDSFAANKRIGGGGFGSVYKGELISPPNGSITTVACKRLDRQFGQGDAEFKKEINMLSQYQHQNLVSLIHFCIESDERILVYEYASRGSLDRYLTDPNLTWIQCLKICIGSAHALNYLHDPRDTHQRIIHRDIKSSNILLDEEWNAKVSDFGLSKFGPANQPQTYLFTNAVGTHGYCDPLYSEDFVLSKESDVYSFGVVLFEVMCGKLCYDYHDGILVPKWKLCFEEKRLDDIINHGLRTQMEPGSLSTFSTIAYQCLKRARKERPTMGQIVQKLEMALEQQEVIDRIGKRMKFEEMRRIADLAVTPLSYVSQSHLLLLFMKGMFVDNGKTWFSVNMRGQQYELISALETKFLEPNIKFVSRVPFFLKYVSNRDLRLKVTTQCLSQNVTYNINLVYKCDHSCNYDMRIPFKYKLEEMGEYLTSCVPRVREGSWVIKLEYNLKKMTQYSTSCDAHVGEDGWLRTKLFRFTSTKNQHFFDIHFTASLTTDECDILGVEFCPEEDEIKVDIQPTDIGIDWAESMPDDYTHILYWSEEFNERMTKKEVYFNLRKGIYIQYQYAYNSKLWFSISKKSKKRLMLPARAILPKEKSRWNFGSRRETWKWKSLPESRFEEVAQICDVNHLEFSFLTQSQLLSTPMVYACYLVFKLPENATMFEGVVVTCLQLLDTPIEHHIYLVAPPHAPTIVLRHAGDERVLRTRKVKGHPKLRKDGWMEVQLWDFLNDYYDGDLSVHGYFKSLSGWNFTGLLVQGIELRPTKVPCSS